MGTIALLGAGVFLGWLLFGNKGKNSDERQKHTAQAALPDREPDRQNIQTAKGTAQPVRPLYRGQEYRSNDHTMRNIAGGVVAGTILGHMLTGNHKSEAHETINNNIYNEYNDHGYDDWEDRDYNYDYDVDHDDDYEHDDYSDYDSYDDSDDYHDDGYDSYDSGSDWGSDSYDDGGDW
ncbi:hypothetical protein [Selenomonas sp. AE3005]|uniref:hypothetical protein n=1 Tax=Selenomonas sp. AE3005 TaxID=1485543 RepID=UPI0025E5DAAF|nr:hypothetical protein [Selenomonas sp. AE3005]